MIVSWGSSEPVVARVMRNIKGVEASYMEDIIEWIAEAIGKMKTPYTVAVTPNCIQVVNHRAKLPCKIQGLLFVESMGCKLSYNENGSIQQSPYAKGSLGFDVFLSINPIYTSSGDLDTLTEGRSKFPRDFIVSADKMPIDRDNWYRINGKILETSICDGEITVHTAGIPKDELGYPLIPEVEEYEEAIYRYCRMMLIESGYEDKVMSYETASYKWEQASGRAISAVSFPTPDQVASSINRNVRLFGAELDDFFSNGPN